MRYACLAGFFMAVVTAAQMTALLNRAAVGGATPDTLYNMGFVFYYQAGFNQNAIPAVLEQGYAGAKAANPIQEKALRQAEAFWRREAAYVNRSTIPDRPASGRLPHPRIKVPAYSRDAPALPMFRAPRRR